MRCDGCLHRKYTRPPERGRYPEVYCAKDHGTGVDYGGAGDPETVIQTELWAACPDYINLFGDPHAHK